MQWFSDAKLGIFIHWGIYSVNGVSESWSFFNNYINYQDYRAQLNGFTAKNYDPQQWVNLIKASGAKYAVITSRHHDGVSLWDSKQHDALTTSKHSAAKKDVLTPFVSALKKSGLKTGIYYSLPDWSHTDYDVFTRERKRYDIKQDPQRFERFIQYYQGQLRELSERYKPDLLWFDGDWEHSDEEWKAKESKQLLQQYNPNIIINSRLKEHGDYATPEQGVPVDKPVSPYWELCYTMNDSWGYQPFDRNYKTPYMLIRTLVDCIAMGGNLLLDIGPKADGSIAVEQVNILKELGRWTTKHSEAIYGTKAGVSEENFAGKSALSKDGKNCYLFLTTQPKAPVVLRGIASGIKNITVLGRPEKVTYEKQGNDYYINVPAALADKDITVVKVSFDEALQLTSPQLKEEVSKTSVPRYIQEICYQVSVGQNPFRNAGLKMHESVKLSANNNETVIAKWVQKHAEVLADAGKGLSAGHYDGLSALSPDKQTVYLFINGKPNGPIALKGISNGIARIRIVGDGTLLEHKVYDKLYWSPVPGIVYIDVPKERLDANMTVVAVLLDSPVKEFHNEVKAIESNL
ncbi:MAG: alpha-L-fucosidase [Niabella sp.]